MKEPCSPDAARRCLSEALVPEAWLSIECKYQKRRRSEKIRSRLHKTLATVLVLWMYSPYMKHADKTFFPTTKPMVSRCLPQVPMELCSGLEGEFAIQILMTLKQENSIPLLSIL